MWLHLALTMPPVLVVMLVWCWWCCCRYAVVGVSMFGENDPLNMGSLHITLLTLFRCATLEDWSDIMYTATTGACRVAWSCACVVCTRADAACGVDAGPGAVPPPPLPGNRL